MLSIRVASAVWVVFGLLSIAAGEEQGNPAAQVKQPMRNRSGPIAKDGDVEITWLEETREKRAYAVPGAARFTRLRVHLQIYVKVQRESDNATFLYRFLKLEPVLDDTGKALAKPAWGDVESPAWMTSWPPVTDEIAVTGLSHKDGKHGHELYVDTEAPARQAKKIRAITGSLEVIETESKQIEVKNLKAQSGKPIDDADLQGIQITPVLEKNVTFSIRATGKVNRLWDWMFIKDKAKLTPELAWEMRGPAPGGLTQKYSEPLPEGTSLVLHVLVPGARHVILFDLKDIELP